jgi:phage FluMu gp28-like protein
MQYADQIDNGAAAGHDAAERCRIVNVGVDELDARKHEQATVAFPIARRNANAITAPHERTRETLPDKSRAPEHADRAAALIIPVRPRG